jgi:PmbA protein
MSGAGSDRREERKEVVRHALASALDAGATEVDALLFESDSHEARVRGEEIEFVKQAQERALGIRAMISGPGGMRTAVTSTSDLDPNAVAKMAAETVALAGATAPDPTAGLPEGGFATDIPDLDLFDPGDRNVSVEARIEEARRAEQAARALDERVNNSEGSQVGSSFTQVVYGNSKDFIGDYETASHSLFSEPLASQGDSMQRDYWMTVGHRLSDLEDGATVGRKAAERALRRLGAKRVKTCEVPVIFDPFTAPSLLGQLVGCLSGYSIYREASFLASKMGDKIAAESITVIDDGRLPAGLGSKPFDGEGLPTRRNVIVEDGVLKTWLLDTYSGRKLDLPSTGNASRGAGGGPGVGSTNLWIEPSKESGRSLDDIISETEKGLLVTELIGMGFNPTTGDYSRGAAGLWIEGGEIQHPVEEITIASNLGDMLAGIDRVGSELTWRGRTACPPLRIAQMTIAGE